MTIRSSLLVVVIGILGSMGFLIWNQQVGPERPAAAEYAGQGAPDHAGQSQQAGGEQESEERAHIKPLEGAEPPRADDADTGKTEKPHAGLAEEAKTYQVDTTASRVYVKVGSATRLGHPHGVEGKLKSGKVSLGAGGELVFDMHSFTADSQIAREKAGLERKKVSENEAKKVTEAMRGATVLDVKKFPTATYKIIAIKPAEKQDAGNPGLYHVNGRFSLHGAEQPLTFKAKLERPEKAGPLKLNGSFVIKQTDYDMKPYSAVGGLVKVANELEIMGELVLSPAK
jgi:polyisoprenoid-binding protein YceI